MTTTNSADGTTIAYDRTGTGPALILVGGPPTADRTANSPVAEALAGSFTVFNYDRRGRGESGDTEPYSIDREYEDLAAVIAAAGGSAYAYGTSGGAIIALEAVARGLSLTRLVLWEPPYILPDTRPAVAYDYADQLRALLADGRRGDMVEMFFTVAVGMPVEFVAPMKDTPFWPAMEAGAHSLVYDAEMMGDFSLPIERLQSVGVPTIVVDGGESSMPWLRLACEAVVDAVPEAEHRTLEGQPHNVSTEAIAPVVVDVLTGVDSDRSTSAS